MSPFFALCCLFVSFLLFGGRGILFHLFILFWGLFFSLRFNFENFLICVFVVPATSERCQLLHLGLYAVPGGSRWQGRAGGDWRRRGAGRCRENGFHSLILLLYPVIYRHISVLSFVSVFI